MRTPEGNKIADVLRSHVGAENAISAPDICRALHLPVKRERHVRRVIADESALWDGILICSTPGKGYFAAASYDELIEHDCWLTGLLTEAEKKLAGFRKLAIAHGLRLPAFQPTAA